MSIQSSFYAEHANSMREEWVEDLNEAIENEDWEEVEELRNKMEDFTFTE